MRSPAVVGVVAVLAVPAAVMSAHGQSAGTLQVDRTLLAVDEEVTLTFGPAPRAVPCRVRALTGGFEERFDDCSSLQSVDHGPGIDGAVTYVYEEGRWNSIDAVEARALDSVSVAPATRTAPATRSRSLAARPATGVVGTGAGSTGTASTGAGDTGSEDTGTESTGYEDTGTEDTGSEDTGTETGSSEPDWWEELGRQVVTFVAPSLEVDAAAADPGDELTLTYRAAHPCGIRIAGEGVDVVADDCSSAASRRAVFGVPSTLARRTITFELLRTDGETAVAVARADVDVGGDPDVIVADPRQPMPGETVTLSWHAAAGTCDIRNVETGEWVVTGSACTYGETHTTTVVAPPDPGVTRTFELFDGGAEPGTELLASTSISTTTIPLAATIEVEEDEAHPGGAVTLQYTANRPVCRIVERGLGLALDALTCSEAARSEVVDVPDDASGRLDFALEVRDPLDGPWVVAARATVPVVPLPTSPSIELEPVSGERDDEVEVRGEGFPPLATIDAAAAPPASCGFELTIAGVEPVILACAGTEDGLTARFRVPELAPGPALVRVVRGGATATAPFTVVRVEPPGVVARDDEATVREDGSVTIAVLTNDGRVGDAPTLTVAVPPTVGTAAVSGRDIEYAPDRDVFGSDEFAYEVCAGGDCDRAAVVVAIEAVPDPPVALDDTARVRAGEAEDVDVLANDDDVDGDLAVSTLRILARPEQGEAAPGPDGTITYVARDDADGSDRFRYQVCDGAGACDEADVEVTIIPQDCPADEHPRPDLTTDVDEVRPGDVIGVEVVWTAVSARCGLVLAGTLTDGDGAWVQPLDFTTVGPVSFPFTVADPYDGVAVTFALHAAVDDVLGEVLAERSVGVSFPPRNSRLLWVLLAAGVAAVAAVGATQGLRRLRWSGSLQLVPRPDVAGRLAVVGPAGPALSVRLVGRHDPGRITVEELD